MKHSTTNQPHVPETPLKIFRRNQNIPLGPFYVKSPDLAKDSEMGEIADEEISALAHIIYNAYLEWKKL